MKGADEATAASLCPEALVPLGDLCPPGRLDLNTLASLSTLNLTLANQFSCKNYLKI